MKAARWIYGALGTLLLLSLAAMPQTVLGQAPAQYTFATVTNMNHLPEFVGIEKGFFVKHGLDLKMKALNTGSEVARAFQSGDAQFVSQSPTTQAASARNGIHLMAVCVILGDATRPRFDDMFAITARPGSGIRPGHLEDLIGKRVGLSLASTEEEYLRLALDRANIPADKVQIVNVPPPDHVSVMRSGSVDAEATWEPYGTMILDQIPGAILVQRGGNYLGYTLWMGSSAEYVGKNPQIMQKLVDAMAESQAYVRAHPAEAAQIATHWIEGLDAKSAQKAVKYMQFDPRFGKNTIAAANLEQNYLMQNKRIQQTIDYTQTTTMTFVDRAMKTEPQFFKDLKPIK